MKSNPADSEKRYGSVHGTELHRLSSFCRRGVCGGSSYKPGEEWEKGVRGGTSLNALRFEMKFEGDFLRKRYQPHRHKGGQGGKRLEFGPSRNAASSMTSIVSKPQAKYEILVEAKKESFEFSNESFIYLFVPVPSCSLRALYPYAFERRRPYHEAAIRSDFMHATKDRPLFSVSICSSSPPHAFYCSIRDLVHLQAFSDGNSMRSPD